MLCSFVMLLYRNSHWQLSLTVSAILISTRIRYGRSYWPHQLTIAMLFWNFDMDGLLDSYKFTSSNLDIPAKVSWLLIHWQSIIKGEPQGLDREGLKLTFNKCPLDCTVKCTDNCNKYHWSSAIDVLFSITWCNFTAWSIAVTLKSVINLLIWCQAQVCRRALCVRCHQYHPWKHNVLSANAQPCVIIIRHCEFRA